MRITRRKFNFLVDHVIQSEMDALYHTVADGENLTIIADRYDLTLDQLASLNYDRIDADDLDNIQVGSVLVVSQDGLDSEFMRSTDWTERGSEAPPCPDQTMGQPPQWGSLPALEWLADLEDSQDSENAYLDSVRGDVDRFVVSDAKRATINHLFNQLAPENYVDINIADDLDSGEILSLLQGIQGDAYQAFQEMIRQKLEGINCDLAFTITREDLEGLS